MYNYKDDNSPEQRVALAKALIRATNEVTHITADDVNPHYKSQFASLGKHLEVVKPAFKKHGLAILQMPIGNHDAGGGTVGIRTVILHESGGFIYADAVVPAGRQADGQDAGKVYSYLRRYAIASISGIATEDDDGEADRIAKAGAKRQASAPRPVLAPVHSGEGVPPPASSPGIDGADTVLKFGKFKGLTIAKAASTKEGRSWLEWKINQPVQEDKYMESNLEFNNVIRRVLGLPELAIGGSDPSNTDSSDDVPF